MAIPRIVKINGVKYKIKRLDADHLGECCDVNKYIAINLKDRRDELPSTLLHEILHAIIAEYKLFVRKEEQLVIGLERGLMEVFKNNPKIAEYIFNGSQKDDSI